MGLHMTPLGFPVMFPDERKHTLALSPAPVLLSEQYWIPRNSFCLGTDNEVSVGALNH